jgi:hypothetical protein
MSKGILPVNHSPLSYNPLFRFVSLRIYDSELKLHLRPTLTGTENLDREKIKLVE